MTRSNLNALADRVEECGPSRDLDSAIEVQRKGMMARQSYPPYYTSNPRAALAMTGWCLVHLSEIGADGLPMAVLTDGTREAKGYCFASPTSGESALARALTAAGLRALAMMQDDPAPTS